MQSPLRAISFQTYRRPSPLSAFSTFDPLFPFPLLSALLRPRAVDSGLVSSPSTSWGGTIFPLIGFTLREKNEINVRGVVHRLCDPPPPPPRYQSGGQDHSFEEDNLALLYCRDKLTAKVQLRGTLHTPGNSLHWCVVLIMKTGHPSLPSSKCTSEVKGQNQELNRQMNKCNCYQSTDSMLRPKQLCVHSLGK